MSIYSTVENPAEILIIQAQHRGKHELCEPLTDEAIQLADMWLEMLKTAKTNKELAKLYPKNLFVESRYEHTRIDPALDTFTTFYNEVGPRPKRNYVLVKRTEPCQGWKSGNMLWTPYETEIFDFAAPEKIALPDWTGFIEHETYGISGAYKEPMRDYHAILETPENLIYLAPYKAKYQALECVYHAHLEVKISNTKNYKLTPGQIAQRAITTTGYDTAKPLSRNAHNALEIGKYCGIVVNEDHTAKKYQPETWEEFNTRRLMNVDCELRSTNITSTTIQ